LDYCFGYNRRTHYEESYTLIHSARGLIW
jgi:hypothetical protein